MLGAAWSAEVGSMFQLTALCGYKDIKLNESFTNSNIKSGLLGEQTATVL